MAPSIRGAAALLLIAALAAGARGAELPAALRDQLASSTYVYIATQRKDGSFGKAAEIWFMWHDGAVWVGTPPTTWRVKRIKHRRPNAKIAVGKPDGPSFDAVGSIVKDPAVAERLFETYAKKYPDRWPGYEQRFKDGMKDGSRVLVKYVPTAASAPASPAGPAAGSSPAAGRASPSARPSPAASRAGGAG